MRIPTFLGLIIIILGLAIGLTLFYQHRPVTVPNAQTADPLDIKVVNVTDHSAAVTWQTTKATIGYLSFGHSSSLGELINDIRDKTSPGNHFSHFVTIDNLDANTTYYYKVRSGPYFYPESSQVFKTASAVKQTSLDESQRLNKPLTGVVINSDFSPVNEAVVILNISGVSPLAALVSETGNFILPTVYLYKQDLSDLYIMTDQIASNLTVLKGDQRSEIKVTLPTDSQPLPKIVLGQNSDFTDVASSSATASASDSATVAPNPDLNGDGKVNSLDLTIILTTLNSKQGSPKYKKEADLNNDGVIDQKDVDLFKKLLSK